MADSTVVEVGNLPGQNDRSPRVRGSRLRRHVAALHPQDKEPSGESGELKIGDVVVKGIVDFDATTTNGSSAPEQENSRDEDIGGSSPQNEIKTICDFMTLLSEQRIDTKEQLIILFDKTSTPDLTYPIGDVEDGRESNPGSMRKDVTREESTTADVINPQDVEEEGETSQESTREGANRDECTTEDVNPQNVKKEGETSQESTREGANREECTTKDVINTRNEMQKKFSELGKNKICGDTYFLMPNYHLIHCPSAKKEADSEILVAPNEDSEILVAPNEDYEILVAPNEDYHEGDRIPYGYAFLKWIYAGYSDGSTISLISRRPKGIVLTLSELSECIACYADTYSCVGGESGKEKASANWSKCYKKLEYVEEDREDKVWKKIEGFLTRSGNTFFEKKIENEDHFKNLGKKERIFRINHLHRMLENGDSVSGEEKYFPARDAIYKTSYFPTIVFVGISLTLLGISFALGLMQPDTSIWTRLKDSFDLAFTGLLGIVLFLFGIKEENDYVGWNLVLARQKIDNVRYRKFAEKMIHQAGLRAAEKGRDIQGHVDGRTSWCESATGTTTILTEIGSHALRGKVSLERPENILIANRRVFIVCFNKYIRKVKNVEDKVWILEDYSENDRYGLENEDVPKFFLPELSHLVGGEDNNN